jgi:signal transduction histidine kinase/ligand-binding sensor domain-containing protein/DNA-binding response OmpR family regulator
MNIERNLSHFNNCCHRVAVFANRWGRHQCCELVNYFRLSSDARLNVSPFRLTRAGKRNRSLPIAIRFAATLLLVVFMFTHQAGAQQPINFTALSTNDGLSSNTINDILKDRFGLMWFATEDGLNKFDGTKFTVYRNKTNDTSSLLSNEILTLHEDRSGNLWVGTSGGSLSLYNRVKDNFINYPAGTIDNPIRNDVILSLCTDKDDNLWIGTYAGINILTPKTGIVKDFLYNGGDWFTRVTFSLFRDSRSRMWIGTNNGLMMHNPFTGKLTQYSTDPLKTNSLSHDQVRVITEDKNGRIWVGTLGGLSLFREATQDFLNYTGGKPGTNHISPGQVTSIAADNDGSMWIGTTTGLDILNPETGQVNNIVYNKRNVQGLTASQVQSLYIDTVGICWIGTYRGGINKYDQNLSLFNLVKSDPYDEKALPATIVTSFAEGDDDQIFVGTEQGGVASFDRRSQTFKRLSIKSRRQNAEQGLVVLALHRNRNGKLLIGTYSDGFFVMEPGSGAYRQLLGGNKENEITSNEIFSITEDNKGNIWLGTNGAGITVLNDRFEVTRRYVTEPKLATDIKLPTNPYIRDIVQDRNGYFWIATHGGGLARLNPASNQFRIYNIANSKLPSEKILTIREDSKGNIWVGSFGGGLGKFNAGTQKFTTYSEEHGLLNNTVYEILEDVTGKLWVATNNGISSFDLASEKFSNYTSHNGLQRNNFVRGAGLRATNGIMYFGGVDGFNYFKPEQLRRNVHVPKILFTDLKISHISVVPSADGPIRENIAITKNIDLEYKQNFALSFVGLNYTSPEQNEYAYKLEGFEKEWNYVGTNNVASYTNLDPGDYVFRVQARNNDGLWNTVGNSIKITVHPPFWQTGYAYVFYVLLFGTIMFFLRYKSIQSVKRKYQLKQEKIIQEQQQRETARIRELDQQKIKFLTNLSHEFRTPISLIMGPIDALITQEKNDHEQSFGQLHMIKRNARRLLNLVNQLLDFRKMEENELKLHPTPGEFISFVREVTDSFKDLADRKKISLVFDNHLHSFNTSFDHDKLERILFNLLSNAFKFSFEGGRICITIQKTNERSDQTTNWLQIKVSDTGIGIPADKHRRIFENFYQDTTAPEILNQGTGIGLSITREFVEMQGGSIAVESEPGKGTCFIIDLPFEITSEPGEAIVTINDGELTNQTIPASEVETVPLLPARSGEPGETSILLVEDNDDFRYYLKQHLSAHYKVLEASNGKEGWQKALAQHPKVIVTDISMPYMDGIELCKKIKADKRTNHIPVILLTALTGENDQIRGLETGANDYITKPFNIEMLIVKVKNLLTLNNSFKNTYTKQLKVAAPEVEAESGDEKLLTEIMNFLEENLTDTQLSVEGLSRHIGMSRSSLYKKLLELTGQTPVEFIRSVKLDKAAAMMEKTDMNIAQVAYSVGFATPNYFAKSFKAKFGMLPSDYVNAKKINK